MSTDVTSTTTLTPRRSFSATRLLWIAPTAFLVPGLAVGGPAAMASATHTGNFATVANANEYHLVNGSRANEQASVEVTVYGTVRNFDGSPAASEAGWLSTESGEVDFVTDNQGRYEVTGKFSGEVSIYLENFKYLPMVLSRRIQVEPGTRVRYDMNFDNTERFWMWGVVRDENGKRQANATVAACPEFVDDAPGDPEGAAITTSGGAPSPAGVMPFETVHSSHDADPRYRQCYTTKTNRYGFYRIKLPVFAFRLVARSADETLDHERYLSYFSGRCKRENFVVESA